ncbi:ATP-binding cassette domain-containing protein, partial [Candidatus Peregrinibacteria bacterium]|nr:ATP-binding cassette domain-containing protein [Candidatus Peregrinibacteria bacterium]
NIRHDTLREAIDRFFKGNLGKEIEKSTVLALKDDSLEVKQGEVLGIIGRNGAGKTTLLKILSRITEPTEGIVRMKGRVSTLLEIGTGFSGELTGRDNIYINGSILGMKKIEIDKKFDEIVAFAELERFIDTPVKRYSSGMCVRLAFAVAAHLEPEILLVDEVLAAGDIGFQKKCLGKMDTVVKEGRTALFVSHDMSSIRSLCNSVIWLEGGKIVQRGGASKVVLDYQEAQIKRFDWSSCTIERNSDDVKDSRFYVSRVEILNSTGESTNIFKYNDVLVLIVDFSGEPVGDRFITEYYLYNQLGQLVSLGSSGAYHGVYFEKNIRRVRIEIGPLVLTSGKYTLSLSTCSEILGLRTDTWENACSFTIIESRPFLPGRDIPSSCEGACILKQSFCAIG